MRKTYIGELEEVVLLTVAILQEGAYGVAITQYIDTQLERKLSISAVHATLHRLSEKGYVNSSMGGATSERGGRRKRYFKVTTAGSRVLNEIQDARSLLWSQVPPNILAT
ncbi:MAG: PadR family transcriptional regulator [Reichenbachiella sp.]|uniref:PadR family transcriptional regulator n=1 Tax=Reichenbachiella sp. TaxID=2184521 RepID=UPI00326555C1